MLCAMPLEIANRELDGALYLAMKLAQKGLPTLIGERMVNEYIFRLNKGKPVIYFDQDHAIKANKKVLDAGGAVINMSSEGLVFEDTRTLPVYANVSGAVSEMCVWGESQMETIRKTLPQDRRHILRLTGTPLFDMLGERFIPYYRKKSIVEQHGENYILINTNFNMYNMRMDLDKYFRMLGRMDEWRLYNDEKVQKNLYRLREYQEVVADTFFDLVRKLTTEFPDRHIIIRPHPTEDLKLYKRNLGDLQNVFVTNESSVRHWIATAGAVIHHDCTTGTEAFLMGKLVISYRAEFDENIVFKMLADIGLDVRSPEEAVEAIRQGQMPQDIASEQLESLKPFFANLTMDASEEISEVAMQYADSTRIWLPEPLGLVENFKCWRKYASKLLRACQPGHNGRKVRFAMSKFPRLPFKNVRDRIDNLRKVDPNLPEVDLTSLALNTFLIIPQ